MPFLAMVVQSLGYASSAHWSGCTAPCCTMWGSSFGVGEQSSQTVMATLGSTGPALLMWLWPPGPELGWPAQAPGSLHLTGLAWCRWARKEQEHRRRRSINHPGRACGVFLRLPEVQLDALAQPYPLPRAESSSWLRHQQ